MSKLLSTYFNPRSPHGERRRRIVEEDDDAYFNPRSPHGERLWRLLPRLLPLHFNPRSPHGERRRCTTRTSTLWRISIHAPRTGSDDWAYKSIKELDDFNPRSPHGERPKCWKSQSRSLAFQSTLPARGATILTVVDDVALAHFNPRSPHGERRGVSAGCCPALIISIHAPRTGSDCARWGWAT